MGGDKIVVVWGQRGSRASLTKGWPAGGRCQRRPSPKSHEKPPSLSHYQVTTPIRKGSIIYS